MVEICLTGKCGSCWYFKPIEGTASGECHKYPYGDDVAHDLEHPYYRPQRSRLKCKEYRTDPITNYDRIVSKTPEELATWIDDYAAYAWCPVDAPIDPETHECLIHDGDCRLCILDWLRKEATE